MRFRNACVIAMLVSAGTVLGQGGVSLRGSIRDQNGVGVKGAIVVLKGRDLRDTSGEDGSFLIGDPVSARNPRVMTENSGSRLLLQRDVLTLEIEKSLPARVDVYSVQGRLVHRVIDGVLPAGISSHRLPARVWGRGLHVLRATLGTDVQARVFDPGTGFGRGRPAEQGPGLAKSAAVLDSLIASHPNYLTARVPVSMLRNNVEVVLFPAAFAGIVWPQPGAELLAGDTIDVVWTKVNPANPAFYFNYNDTAGLFNDASWRQFAAASVLATSPGRARIKLPGGAFAASHDFRLMVKGSGGDSVVSGACQIDHLILLTPAGGEHYKTGDTLHITWRSTRNMNTVLLCFSHDKSLDYLTYDLGIEYPTMAYDWVIGEQSFALADVISDGVVYLRQYDDANCLGHWDAPGLYGDRNTIPISIVK